MDSDDDKSNDLKETKDNFGKAILDAWNLFDIESIGITDEYGESHSLMDILKRCHKRFKEDLTDSNILKSDISDYRSY